MASPDPVLRAPRPLPTGVFGQGRSIVRYLGISRGFRSSTRGRVPAPPPMRPLVAVPGFASVGVPNREHTVRIWTSEPIDRDFAPTLDPARYTVTTPDGPVAVIGIEVDMTRQAYVRLTFPVILPDAACSVAIAAGTLRSAAGAVSGAVTLAFHGAPTPGPGPGPEPTEPPVVSGWSPPIGSTIEKTQEIAFEVTCPGGVATVIAWVRFDRLHVAELGFDGGTFRGLYSGTVEEIPDGRRFIFRRSSGWISPPVIVVHATSCDGEETIHAHG